MLVETAPWRGRLCVDVARDAIAWWDVELKAIAEAARMDADARKPNLVTAQMMAYPARHDMLR
jgi:hypothetical protein